MMCAWNELLSILPQWMRQPVDKQGKEVLQELRLRLGAPPVLTTQRGRTSLQRPVTADDLNYTVNTACRYSPWTAATAASGYITAPGGHRIGLCGEAVVKNGEMTGFRTLRSLNIRIARDFPGIAKNLATLRGNIIILGRPGSGKTTLLRDLIRQRALTENVAVVDERGELFPVGFDPGVGTDILTGCAKPHGIDTVLRTMGADTVAVDEITAAEDCEGLLRAGFCGVRLLATAHAVDLFDLKNRAVYAPVVKSRIFDTAVILHADKSFGTERIML